MIAFFHCSSLRTLGTPTLLNVPAVSRFRASESGRVTSTSGAAFTPMKGIRPKPAFMAEVSLGNRFTLFVLPSWIIGRPEKDSLSSCFLNISWSSSSGAGYTYA